jgi:hypothetical protein
MTNCKHCDKPLTHVEGRKQKSFCDVNCRNKWFYAKRQKMIKAAIKIHDKELSDFACALSLGSLPEIAENDNNQKKIAELEIELNRVPDSGLGKKLRLSIQNKIYKLKHGI